MNFLGMIPLVFRLLNIVPQIQAALKTGTSIWDLLQKFSPDMIDLVKGFAVDIFPNLNQEQQIQAGAMIAFDPEQVKFVQDSLNRLGIPDEPLIPDGHYGVKTKAAIEKFQEANPPLVVDGWGGRVTQAVIQSALVLLPPPSVRSVATSSPVTGQTS